jgi:hypothetical protein
LGFVVLFYGVASLVHFAHNAEYLERYPNLPAWLTRPEIYGAWLVIAAIGVTGYALYRRGWRIAGLSVLAIYAAVGFDGLLHYGRAPIAVHTAAMNATIWLEVVAAAVLLMTVAALAVKAIAAAR